MAQMAHAGPRSGLSRTMPAWRVLALVTSLAAAAPAAAEGQHPTAGHAPARSMEPQEEHAQPPSQRDPAGRHAAHDEPAMHDGHTQMPALLGPYPMSREASGTSWQPDATPFPGRSHQWGGWHGMTQAAVNLAYADASGPRGDHDTFAQSMAMAMAARPLGDGRLGLRAMLSLDRWGVGRSGYPLLFQTGETADGRIPLIDRQHPHDLFMELAVSYAHPVGEQASLFIYAGLPGEPALGPPTYMHRASGMDNPEAPLGHHWLAATHISFGVVTLGWVWRDLKLEASAFNAREPDHVRTNIETGALDSWAARISYNPNERWSMQLSHGELDSPEQLEPGVDAARSTASVIHHRPFDRGHWQTAAAWGRNDKRPGEATDAWLLESAVVIDDVHTLFARVEHVDKDELFRHDEPLHGQRFAIGKATLGVVHDFRRGPFGRFGIGAQYSRFALPVALRPIYGEQPDSWLLFLRWKP
jgi:hypothetical protein